MQKLFLHDSMTRASRAFEPSDGKNVRMYVCGPTVYDYAHVGNARPAVVFDVLYRLLKRSYGAENVCYVHNITDIDDKIMTRAKESGEPISSITARTEQAYFEDMAALNVQRPNITPRATEHVDGMMDLIDRLIENKNAYFAEGHVLFSVASMKNKEGHSSYGQLSRLSQEELIAGARVDVAPYKQDPGDFVLWKPSAPEQPGWDRPGWKYGRGRPGWHIECSAMAEQYLGKEKYGSHTFDIHGGGLDLRFPHHENEIAQSCCAHKTEKMANFWLHNGFLSINGAKMSKSLGNFFTVRELLAKYPGEVIRLVLLSTHYRQPLDFTDEALERAKKTLDRWYQALRRLASIRDMHTADEVWIDEHLSDDLNTPDSLSIIHELVNDLNAFSLEGMDDIRQAAIVVKRGLVLHSAQALGLLQQDPEAWFKWQPAGQDGLSDTEIEARIAARNSAKQVKNFAEADRIRQQLQEQNIILEDKPGGKTEWRRG